ncbi:MAG: phosphoribosylformimino-5-aminoimidazole carboxamide ribotide isomerase [Planctomycetota bacterium]
MTRFRPCIDLHQGQVKQIVGGSLRDDGAGLRTNFTAEHDAAWYAARYRDDGLTGGHVIMLGAGNEDAARAALAAYPGGLQVGGGIDAGNAGMWLEAGAAAVIVTSWLFPDDDLDEQRLHALSQVVPPEQLVIDLSCRRRAQGWYVATRRWQHVTRTRLSPGLLEHLAGYCHEFLIHAADVEGLCAGIDEDLVTALAQWSPRSCTYAGGGRELGDLERVSERSRGRIDLTFGSALDLFGGSGVRYADCLAWNRR